MGGAGLFFKPHFGCSGQVEQQLKRGRHEPPEYRAWRDHHRRHSGADHHLPYSPDCVRRTRVGRLDSYTCRRHVDRAAVVTWLSGVWYLARANNLGNAITLGHLGQDYYGLVIGIGAWFGTIMFFNVWVFIWPNQKKTLVIFPATDEEKAKARKVAAMASRINFVLSIPLLLCMGASNHPLPF